MPSISALLRSAQSAQKKVRQQQDALAAYQWNSSAQTYSDFVDYQKYLEGQAGKTSDPSERLSYQTTVRSARRSYVSNEIQRQTQDIQFGDATTKDKMDAVKGLYDQAIANEDYNLAQNLISNYATLNIQFQNEQQAAIKAYQSAGDQAFNDLVKSIKTGVGGEVDPQTGESYVRLPNGDLIKPIAQLENDLQQNAKGLTGDFWNQVHDTLDALRGVVIDQYDNASSQDEINKLETTYGVGLQDLDKKLKFSGLDVQDVVNAQANESFNNPLYSVQATRNETTGKNEYTLKKNAVDNLDYVRQIDENGNESYVPATVRTDQSQTYFGSSDQQRVLGTQITDNGEVIGGNVGNPGKQQVGNVDLGSGQVARDASLSIGNRLKNLGIIAKQDGTTLQVKLPGENVFRQAVIQPDGSIRYYNDNNELVEFGVTDRNLNTVDGPQVVKAGMQRVVAPDNLSDFGTQSAFGGQLSAESAAGHRYLQSITGEAQAPQNGIAGLTGGGINIANDFSGNGTPVTSALLQTASQTRQQVQLQQQMQQAILQSQSMPIQSSNVFNLNQTPVSQFDSMGVQKSQLKVATPTPTPRVYVAPPTQTPVISGVNVAQPTQRISGVGVAPAQPRVVVR